MDINRAIYRNLVRDVDLRFQKGNCCSQLHFSGKRWLLAKIKPLTLSV